MARRWRPAALLLAALVAASPALAATQAPIASVVRAAGAGLPPAALLDPAARKDALLSRLEGWKVYLPEGGALTLKRLPEMHRLKAGLLAEKDPAALGAWETAIALFEGKLTKDLLPALESLSPEDREKALHMLAEQKRALVELHKKRVSLDGKHAEELDALKEKIFKDGLDPRSLAGIYDQIRRLGGSAQDPAPASAWSFAWLPGRLWTEAPAGVKRGVPSGDYPAPRYLPARGSIPVPNPGRGSESAGGWGGFWSWAWGEGAKGAADEAQVVAIAKTRGMNADIVRQAFREASRQGVDYRMVLAVIQQESQFDPSATSPVGARGLMQIMPGTGRDLGVADKRQLYDPATNIRAGVRYLKELFDQFSDVSFYQLASLNPWTRGDVKKAIAAYNAGPNAVKKFGRVPPYRETQDYVVKVLRNYTKFREIFPEAQKATRQDGVLL